MAIVKANYTKNRNIAKAGVGYMEQRPGKDGAKDHPHIIWVGWGNGEKPSVPHD